MVRFIDALKPLFAIVPEVEQPDRRLPFRDRAVWTATVLLVFLVMSQLPLYGARASTADPFFHMRLILGSSRGTLMELGISPLITSMMVFQLLAGAKVIDVNHGIREDRALLQSSQKLFAIVIAFVQSIVYVFSGMYADVSALGVGNSVLIILQLFLASFIVLLMDELLQKGYGIGSGVSLFTCCATCSDIVWKTIGPIRIETASGTQFWGVLLAIPHLLITRGNKFGAIYDVLFRSENGLCGIVPICVSLAVAGAIVYLQIWRVEVQVKYQKYRGQQGKYPIKLLYTSNMPLVLHTAFVSNIYFMSQTLYSFAPNNIFSSMFGRWEVIGGESVPVAGLAYFITAPRTVIEMLLDPFHTLFYIMFVISMCALFSKAWIEISGTSARGVARELKDNQMVIKGHRDTALEHELNRYIPTAATFGAMCLAALAVIADLFGMPGSGAGIAMAVTIIFQYYETVTREYGGNIAQLIGE